MIFFVGLMILCILVAFSIYDALISCLTYWARDMSTKGIIYDGVVCKFQSENRNFVESFDFKRKYKKAFDEYRIVVDFIIDQEQMDNETLTNQLIDRIFAILTCR